MKHQNVQVVKLGNLKVTDGWVRCGDPCYFSQLSSLSSDATKMVAVAWPDGEYPVYLQLTEDRPGGLYVVRYSYVVHSDAHDMSHIANLGVDSGQLAFMNGSAQWGTDSDSVDFDNPRSSYEWACHATLKMQLQAGPVMNLAKPDSGRVVRETVSEAFASSTHHGDGLYPLYQLKTYAGDVLGLFIDFDEQPEDDSDDSFTGIYDDDLFDEDDSLLI